MLPLNLPIPLFTFDSQIVENGLLYVGTVATNPVTNPVTVYLDFNGTIPIAQPLTIRDGYVMNGAFPVVVYIPSSCSMSLYDAHNKLLLNLPDSTNFGDFLSDGTDVAKGDALVAVKQPFTGAVVRTQHDKNTDIISTKDFGCVGDGVTDDTTAFTNAIANIPLGSQLRIDGIMLITSPIVVSRRLNIVCPGSSDAILLQVGVTNNGITFQGDAAGLSGIDLNLNVYGRANSCKNAVVLSRVDRSQVYLNVRAGCPGVGVLIDGCLIDTIYIQSTVNFTPPISSPGMQTDHILVQKNVAYTVSTNACIIGVNLEGARHGIIQAAEINEGNNKYYGCIEGVSGTPFNLDGAIGPNMTDLWIEANGQASVVSNTVGAHIGATIQNFAGAGVAKFQFTDCIAPVVDGMSYGKIDFDLGTSFGTVRHGAVVAWTDYSGEGYGYTSESSGSISLLGTKNVSVGAYGAFTLENIYSNPYLRIWANGSTSAPDCTTLVNATIVKAASTFPYGMGVHAQVTVTSAGAGNGLVLAPLNTYLVSATADRWLSVTIPIFLPAGQTGARILINGSAIATVITTNEWVVVRGGAFIPAATPISVVITHYDVGSSYDTGIVYVGGCSMVLGSRAPKYLCDHGREQSYIVGTVANQPAFQGQRAYVSGTGKWYMAHGTSSSADWDLLN